MNESLCPAQCMLPGPFIDSRHPAIVSLAASLSDTDGDHVKTAVTLYYWVRDRIRYNPYRVDTVPTAYLAMLMVGLALSAARAREREGSTAPEG